MTYITLCSLAGGSATFQPVIGDATYRLKKSVLLPDNKVSDYCSLDSVTLFFSENVGLFDKNGLNKR